MELKVIELCPEVGNEVFSAHCSLQVSESQDVDFSGQSLQDLLHVQFLPHLRQLLLGES